MPSKHFTDIRVTHLTNEDACLANGGSWCVEYKRDGVPHSNGFHTAAVATTFATKLEAGGLDDLPRPAAEATREQQKIFLMREALELIAQDTRVSPAVVVMLARTVLAKVALL